MGLHNSGAHALIEYVHRFFDVDVYPRMVRKKHGILSFGEFSLWKHTVPLAQLPLPSTGTRGRVTLLLTVRDVISWLLPMSRKPYKLFTRDGRRRKHGDMR